jgi:LysR family cyn operon transcriptional activator
MEGGGAKQLSQLDRGEVHLALMPSGIERFHSRLLYPIHVLAVLSKTHRLGRRHVLDISQIADEPLLLLNHEFASRAWFDAACDVAHISPRVVLESGAPHTLVALAQADYGIAIVPSNYRLGVVRGVPLVHRGASVGRWSSIAWNPQRFLAPYAERFVEELVEHVRRVHPGRDLTRRAPPLPRPKPTEPVARR